jgi:predicted TIM-barrel fold metal-dependent hydrolase
VELQEAAFFQSIADKCNAGAAGAGECVPVLGIVAGAPIHQGALVVEEYLDSLLEIAPKTRAVREAIWKKGADVFLSDAFVEGLTAVARRNLTFDLLVKNWQLKDIATLAKRVPDLRFNLNHIGYPSISNATLESDAAWQKDISALAALPNVFCKLSGLPQTYSEFGWLEDWKKIVPYVRHVIKTFGASRVNFAGNWFVLNHDGWNACTSKYDCDSWSYGHMVTLVRKVMESLELSADELEQVFSGTAVNLYSLNLTSFVLI